MPNLCLAYENADNIPAYTQSSEQELADQLLSLKITMSKLRELIYSLKDIKDLENAGLPQRDAELMYETLLTKITQTKNQTLSLITSL